MKLFVNTYAVSFAFGAEVSSFKDITYLCAETEIKIACAESYECTNGGTCEEAYNSTSRPFVGPIELLDDKLCNCPPGKQGPSCVFSGATDDDKCPGENYCKNGGINSFFINPLSGCDCTGTHSFGWHCEHDNLELCAYVDYDGMSDWVESEMNATDCGECLWHDDCIQSNATCIFDKSRAKPNNYCVVPCTEGDIKEHADCVYDDNAGQHVWKCQYGYEDDCATLKPCEERCLNGSENNCAEMENPNGNCTCDDPFEGAFCEKVDQCHPELCDPLKNDWYTDNGEKHCVAKTSSARIGFSVTLLGFASLIELLL